MIAERDGATAQAARLIREIARGRTRRIAILLLLSTIAAAGEGGGVLLLVPLLELLGLDGKPNDAPRIAREVGHALGVEGALFLYMGLMIAISIAIYGRTVLSAALNYDYAQRLRRQLHEAVMSMEWRAFTRQNRADLVHALTTEVNQCGFGVDQLLRSLAHATQLPALLVAAVSLSAPFTAVALFVTVLFAAVVRPLNRKAYELAGRLRVSHQQMNSTITDGLAGLRVLKMLSAERAHIEDAHFRSELLRDAQLAQSRAYAVTSRAQALLTAFVATMGLWIGLQVMHLPLPRLLVLLVIFGRIASSASAIQDNWRSVLRILPVHQSIQDLLADCQSNTEPGTASPPPPLRHHISFTSVDYRHEKSGPPTLRDLNFVIPALTTTALVGPSGAGKSTIADLIMGLLTPTNGGILVDDQPLDETNRIAWRSRIGYVPQDPFLFHDSVRANLLLARPDASEEQLRTVLDLAAANFVHRLPGGLEAIVGDRGTRLSGGERQRIVLARALLQQPDLLVLDEATSALDEGTEGRILAALKALHGQMTVLVIAHRPSSIALADQIISLDAGRIIQIEQKRADLATPTDATVDHVALNATDREVAANVPQSLVTSNYDRRESVTGMDFSTPAFSAEAREVDE